MSTKTRSYWGAEGMLVHWALGATSLLLIFGGVCITSWVAVRMLAGLLPQGARVAARNI